MVFLFLDACILAQLGAQATGALLAGSNQGCLGEGTAASVYAQKDSPMPDQLTPLLQCWQLRRLRQENCCKFKASLCPIGRLCLKKQQNKTKSLVDVNHVQHGDITYCGVSDTVLGPCPSRGPTPAPSQGSP